MKRLFILILSLCTVGSSATTLASPASQKNTGSIEGTVIDRSTQHPLPGAGVALVGTQLGSGSNFDGAFLITHVPTGTYQIKASMLGYRPEVKTEIVVSTNRVTMVNFQLSPTVLDLGEEIVVTAKAAYFEKEPENPISAKTLTPREIRSSAGSGEDIFRIIQSMPGVSSAGARSANLVVRGGAPDENRTLLDNVEIYNPLHFARQGASMGIISMVNPSLLQSVDFLTGGFPAQYGDKMSSVFEMQLKEGNRTQFNTDVNANLAGLGVLLDGPIPGDGTMVFSARRGFFDILTSMMNRPVAPRYWDLVGKATHTLGTNHKLSLVGFYYLDDVEKTGSMEDAGSEAGRKYDYGRRDDYGSAIGLNWRYLYSTRGYVLTTAALTGNGWKSWFGTESNRELRGEDVAENEAHLKSALTYKVFDGVEVKGGVFWKHIDSEHHTWRDADTTRTGFVFPADTVSYDPDPTFKAGAFVQTLLRPFPLLSINAGLRWDYFEFTDESKLSPRIGLSYHLTDKTTLNAAYGHFYQTPAAYQVALDPANTTLRSSSAIHAIAGVEHLLSPDTKLSVEVYHKELDDVFVDSDTSSVLSNAGSGYARGIEFYVQKKMSKNLVGSVAYTYSVSERKDGAILPEYDFEFDRPHNFTLVSGYKLSDKWQIGAKFQYASGSPYTPVVGTVQKGGAWYVVEGEQNSTRYPDYHKLDIRIDRRFHFEHWTLSAYLDLWNAYYRDNVLSYRFEVDEDGAITRDPTYDFPLLPIVGVSAQF